VVKVEVAVHIRFFCWYWTI